MVGSGLTRRLGPAGGRWWQIATRWGAYTDYLRALADSLGTTALPGVGKVRLDDSFAPVRVREFAVDDLLAPGPEGRSSTSLPEALATCRQLLLIGPAGTGKSALLRHHTAKLATDVLRGGRRALVAEGAPRLPVYLGIVDRPSGDSLETRIVGAMRGLGFEEADEFLSVHLAVGRTVVLIDDLDTLDPDGRRRASEEIAAFVEQYPGNQIVVATRDFADARWFTDFKLYEVAGIDSRGLDGMAIRWGLTHQPGTAALLRVIDRFPLVRSLAARPGWLAMLLADANPQVEDRVAAEGSREGGPNGRTLEADHHLSSDAILEGFVTRLEPSGSAPWTSIALAMTTERTALGDAAVLAGERRLSSLIQWLDDDQFRFVHRAVQAHLTAVALTDQPHAVLALVDEATDPWWSPVILLVTSRLKDPSALVRALLDAGHAELAALALAELPSPPVDLRLRTVMTLLASLADEGVEGAAGSPGALAALLRSEDVRSGGPISPVLAALADPAAEVRRAAARALGRLGQPAAIAPLLGALGDGEADVRAAAADALATFGNRTVQPLVRQLSAANDNVRQAATWALAQQGEGAVKGLLPLLESSSATLRSEAAAALASVGAPAMGALVAILSQHQTEPGSPGQKEAAAQALKKLGGPAALALIPLLPDATPDTRAYIAEVLHDVGPAAVAALGDALAEEDHPYAAAAAAMLGELPADEEAARVLIAALVDPRFEVRYEVRRALRSLGGIAESALLQALTGSDEAVSWEAAQLLLDLPEPPVGALLEKLAKMLDSEDPTERRRAVRAIAPLSGPKVRELLEAHLSDPDAVVRRSIVTHLGHSDDASGVTALAALWPDETDPEVQSALLDAMQRLAPEAAAQTLIDGLAAKDEGVRRHATALLVQVGDTAVVPLIEALNRRPSELHHDNAMRVLEDLAATTRTGGHTPANLARAYYRLLVETLDVDEIVYIAATLEWWPPAQEFHRTFVSLKEFLEYRTLAGIGNAERTLDWVDKHEDWLRPAAGRALRQLRSISQAVQYYNRGSRRRSKEKGLLAAADRLNQLRSMIGDLGPPHDRVFLAVADHWSERVNEAIRQLQGKSELELDIRTDSIRIRDLDTTAVLVFEVSNEGEGLASNIQMTLEAPDGVLELLSTPVHYLPPLGQGDRVTTEFTIRRQGEGVVPVNLDLRYDDPQVEGQTRRFAREVRFFVEETPYKEIGTSPYIAGPPVKTPAMFYGREDVFEWVQENLSGTYQDNVLVLYGERRTGKTSVLYQLPYRLPETYAFVLTDLQSIAYALGSTSDLLHAMARKLTNGLRKQGFDLPKVEREEFEAQPIEVFVELGETVGDMAVATGRRAVLIVDEFDLLIEAVERGDVSPFVFDCIRGLMQHQDGLSFIFAGAHKLSAMLKNPQSILFNTALRRKVSFLHIDEAERLIREPVKDVLWYEELAVEKILRVTAGQPYFIQYILHELVNLARQDSRNFITLRDVDRALQTTVVETTGIIRHSYMSLDRGQQVTLAAMASIADDGRPFVGLEDVTETLRQDHVTVSKRDLFDTLRQLVDRDFIIERRGEGTEKQYGFAMDLVRIWLERNDEYTRLVEELQDEPAS